MAAQDLMISGIVLNARVGRLLRVNAWGFFFIFFIITSYQVDPKRADTAIVCTPTKSAHKRSLNTGVQHMQQQKKAGVPSELSGKCEESHLVRTWPI